MDYEPKAFFVFGDGGMHAEPSLDQAAGYMEPIDVEGGEYDDVFDDTGRRYRFSVVEGTTRLESSDVVDLGELKRRLREQPASNVDGFDADDPLRTAVAISRWEWDHRWPRWPGWLSRRIHGSQPRIMG